jgi:hypothetical protein
VISQVVVGLAREKKNAAGTFVLIIPYWTFMY